MRNFVAVLACVAMLGLAGCAQVKKGFSDVHKDVFGCPPVEEQEREYEKVPNMEKILNLPTCDDPKPVYEPDCVDGTCPGK